jgi:hypothetical protein
MVLIVCRRKSVCSEIQWILYNTPLPMVLIVCRRKSVCAEIQWILYNTPLPMVGCFTNRRVFARKYNEFCTIHHLLWLDLLPMEECLLGNTMISVQYTTSYGWVLGLVPLEMCLLGNTMISVQNTTSSGMLWCEVRRSSAKKCALLLAVTNRSSESSFQVSRAWSVKVVIISRTWSHLVIKFT